MHYTKFYLRFCLEDSVLLDLHFSFPGHCRCQMKKVWCTDGSISCILTVLAKMGLEGLADAKMRGIFTHIYHLFMAEVYVDIPGPWSSWDLQLITGIWGNCNIFLLAMTVGIATQRKHF